MIADNRMKYNDGFLWGREIILEEPKLGLRLFIIFINYLEVNTKLLLTNTLDTTSKISADLNRGEDNIEADL